MKKTFSLLLFSIVISVHAFAQDIPQKGDIIYGSVSDDEGPLRKILITEVNSNNRIMAQTVTDANGNFSFRLVNPDDRIVISRVGYETKDLSINKKCYEISMRKQEALPPIQIMDGPPTAKDQERMKEISGKIQYEASIMTKDKRQDIYLPYKNNITYGSIQELFDNLYLEF